MENLPSTKDTKAEDVLKDVMNRPGVPERQRYQMGTAQSIQLGMESKGRPLKSDYAFR